MNQCDFLASVIIPIHNEGGRLNDAVRSVLSQSYSALQIILIDDRSTDNGRAIAKDLEKEHSNIIFVRFTRNPGPCGTRNAGLELALGRLITYLDGNDLMAPERISNFVRYLADSNNCAMVIGEGRLEVAENIELPASLQSRRHGDRSPYTMSMMHWKNLLDTVDGFDETYACGENSDFIVSTKAAGKQVDLISIVGTIRRMHGSNLTYRHAETPTRSILRARLRDRHKFGHKVTMDSGTLPNPKPDIDA